MQAGTISRPNRHAAHRPDPAETGENVLFIDKKHLLYRRMERWVRLQQFVYGLPGEFSYSVHSTEEGGVATCRTLVNVGWMSWYGVGRAPDPQQALALALLETSDAITASAHKVFFYSVAKWLKRGWRRIRGAGNSAGPAPQTEGNESRLLAS